MKNNIVIAPANVKKEVFKHLLKEDNAVLMGTQVIPLNVFKDNLVSYLDSKEVEVARLFKDIQTTISKDNMYKKSLRFPTFFMFFYDFINDLVSYGIDINDLPAKDKEEIDKKEILNYLYNQPLRSKKIKDEFNKINDATNISIYDSYYDDIKDVKDIEFLISKGAAVIINEKKKNESVEVRFAKNNSQEIASVAQYLINNNVKLNETTLLVNDIDNNYPIVNHILSLYSVPHNVSKTTNSSGVKQFIALLNLMNKLDTASFLDAYNEGAFYFKDVKVVDYINYLSLTYEQILKPFTYVNDWKSKDVIFSKEDLEKEYNPYKNMLDNETEVEKIMVKVREKLATLNMDGSLLEKTTSIFNLIKGNFRSTNEEEISSLIELRSLCLNIVPILNDIDNGEELLSYFVEGIKKKSIDKYDDYLQITDIYKNINDKKLVIIIGCSQDKFPKTINKKGFFDEFYINKVKGYPSIQERTDFFNEQFNKLLNSMPNIIFSYATNDLSGNKLYKSAYLDKYSKEEPWPIKNINYYSQYEPKLSEETAKKIFVAKKKKIDNIKEKYKAINNKELQLDEDKQVITLSPSSVQQYVGCHFKYFLEKGLGMYDNQAFELNISTLGTIMHKALEDYYQSNKEKEVKDSINESFEALKELFINDNEYLDIVKQRVLKSLKFKIDYIDKDFEHSDFQPNSYEYNIIHAIKSKNVDAVIDGSIDRLDTYVDSDGKTRYRIVDYKSSNKKIKGEDIINGKNIQLPTYLTALKKENPDYIPMAMTYFNLSAEFPDYKIAKVLARSLEVIKMDLEEERGKKDKYNEYKDITIDNDQLIIEEDYEKLSKIIEDIYKITAESILSGDITIDPKNKACDFCKFGDICHSAIGEYDSEDSSEIIDNSSESEGEEE